jgi:hypothetical protein
MAIRIQPRTAALALIQRRIDDHIDDPERLEDFANPWWRCSRYVWLCAANIHRSAARQLASIKREIEAGIYDQ